MTTKNLTSVIFICFFILTSSFTFKAESSIRDWDHLGSRKVNFRLDRDVIKVGAIEGGYTKLKIQVTGGNLNMHKLIVQYGNGKKDVIELRHNFSKGSGTRIIDLRGRGRIIRDITFWYDTKTLSGRRAKVHVFGRQV